MGDRTIRIKESVVTQRTYTEEEYTPDRIREIWAGETAQTCLALALLERWENVEQQLNQARAALDEANRDCVVLREENGRMRNLIVEAERFNRNEAREWVMSEYGSRRAGAADALANVLRAIDAAQEGK